MIILPFIFSSVVATAQVQQQAVCKVPPGKPSNLAIHNGRVCLDKDPTVPPEGRTVRFVGYGGITQVTVNERWRSDSDCNNNCDPDANTCSSTAVRRTLATLQVDLSTPKSGANITRIFTLGGSCNVRFSAANNTCQGFSNRAELMPFERLPDGKFNVTFVDESDPGVDGNLNRCWEARFRSFLKEAERNGIVVIVSLFDENTMTGIGNTTWDNNPWNPKNSNLGNLLPPTRSALPAFYNICPNMAALKDANGKCADASLNRLGQIQKKYVTKIVEAVQKSGVRNVMFEVMNQARIEDNAAEGSHVHAVVLAAWHNTVANWFTDYLWVASVKKAQDQDMRSLLRDCRSNTNCKDNSSGQSDGNPLLVFWRTGIDILKPHFSMWPGNDMTGDICQVAGDLFRYGKPVMIDNDGAPRGPSNDNRVLADWATTLCGRPHGSMHFYHTKDGTKLRGREAPACEEPDTIYMDCDALDSLAGNNASPTNLCGKIRTGIGCPPKNKYCNACYGNAQRKL